MPTKDLIDAKKNATVIITKNEIEDALLRLAEQLNADYHDKNPIFLVVLNGGLIFSGQLLPKIKVLCQLDYCHATRYRGNLQGADIQWKAKPQMDLSQRHIIIVDDILDEGHTLQAISEYCFAKHAKSVKSLILVEKKHQRKAYNNQKPDYCELTVPDEYVFGFGMDYAHHWRNSNDIYSLNN